MAIPLYAAIPAGGQGTRLRPATGPGRPKPLLTIPDPAGPSLLGQTLARLDGLVAPERRALVVGSDLASAFAAAGDGAAVGRRLTEPVARGTGPALVLAARWAMALNPDAIVLNTPADHWVGDPDAWRGAVARAAELAVRGYLVLLGVTREEPDTGYGYIHPGGTLHGFGHKVAGFHEKPDAAAAASLLAEGALVNAGIFVWRARIFLETVAEHRPDWTAAIAGPEPDPAAYGDVAPGSVDREILERAARRLAVVPLDATWDDVGTWDRLYARMAVLGLCSPIGGG